MPTLNIGDHVHHCTIFRGNEIIEMAFKSLNQKFLNFKYVVLITIIQQLKLYKFQNDAISYLVN